VRVGGVSCDPLLRELLPAWGQSRVRALRGSSVLAEQARGTNRIRVRELVLCRWWVGAGSRLLRESGLAMSSTIKF